MSARRHRLHRARACSRRGGRRAEPPSQVQSGEAEHQRARWRGRAGGADAVERDAERRRGDDRRRR